MHPPIHITATIHFAVCGAISFAVAGAIFRTFSLPHILGEAALMALTISGAERSSWPRMTGRANSAPHAQKQRLVVCCNTL